MSMQGCAAFLRSFWGSFDSARAHIALVKRKNVIAHWLSLCELEALEDDEPTSDIYFTVAAHNDEAVAKNTRTKATASYLPGLFLDIDCASPWRKDDDFPTKDAVLEKFLELFENFPPPTIVVDSGGGLYPFWAFTEPKLIETEDDRVNVDNFIKSFRKHVSNKLGFKNTVVDPAMNLATILRLPGSLNQKQDPPVQTSWDFWTDGSNRYEYEKLLSITPLMNIRPPPVIPVNKKLLSAVAKSAYECALRRIKNASVGMRNTVAYMEAAEVGVYYAAGEITDDHLEELIAMHIRAGEEPKKARDTITRGVRDGVSNYTQRAVK